MPFLAASSAALCAANAVDLRDPLNPMVPALPQAKTFPCGSVIVIKVLLNVDCTYARPTGTDLRSRRLVRCLLAIVGPSSVSLTFLLPGHAVSSSSHRPSLASLGTGVGAGTLPPYGQPAPVAISPVAADVYQPPYV